MNACGGRWPGWGQWFLGRIGERLDKTMNNGLCSTLPQSFHGIRQVVEAKFRASLPPYLGDFGAISTFRAGRREEFVGVSARLQMVILNDKEMRPLN